MTKSLKRKFIVGILVVFLACVSISTALLLNNKTAQASVFEYGSEVKLTYDKPVSSSFLSGKKGYMFSTDKVSSVISVKNDVAGTFSVEFTPLSDKIGTNDFSQVAFDFSCESVRLGFSVKFVAEGTGVKMRIFVSSRPVVYKEIAVDGSFCGGSAKAISFSFDPINMRVYDANKALVADFKSEQYMLSYDMGTLIDSFSSYSVDVSFGNIVKGKTAKIVLFELCGQRLDKEKVDNTSAPVIYSYPELSDAVVGKTYAIPTNFNTYDVLDGNKNTFDGQIKVTDNLNKEVEVIEKDGSYYFTPSASGIYNLNYTPVDSHGLQGETYVAKIFAFANQPEISFNSQYPIEDLSVGKLTKLAFPAITARSDLSLKNIKVSAIISDGSQTVKSIEDCSNGFSYTFDKTGEYKVTFSATDYVGYTEIKEVIVTVTDAAVFYNCDLKDVYAKDEIINFGSVYALYNGQSYAVNSVIEFPDGRINQTGNAKLDVEGVYKVTFTTNVSGADLSLSKYFTVKNNNVSLWTAQSGLTVTSDALAPSYADQAYRGSLLTVNRPIEAEYKNVIDLSDNTGDDLLAEIFVAPTTAGVIETGCVDLILTDIYNPENVIDIRLTQDAWLWESMKGRTSIIAQPVRDFDNAYLDLIHKATKDDQRYYYYGRGLYSSLYGKIENSNESSPAQSVKLYFDYQTGKLYASVAATGGLKGKLVVADLGSEEYVGSGNLWKKFTTGEAKLTVKISKLFQDANVMIINIDGQNMSGEYTADTTAPSIFLDYYGNSEQNIPTAVVGKPYRIFTAYTQDIAEGTRDNVTVSVFRKQGDLLIATQHNNKTFLPTTAGEYIIRYDAVDESGNASFKEVTVIAKNANEILAKNYIFSDKLLSSVLVGQTFTFYKGVASGGTGVLDVDYKITLDGQEITLDENDSFKVMQDGEYQIAVTVSDFIEKSKEFIYKFTAEYSDDCVFNLKTMPKATVKGEEITLPELTAVKYTEDGEQNVPVEVYIDGAKISSLVYTPEQAGSFTVKYVAGEQFVEYVIAVTDSEERSESYTSRFFYSDAQINVIERSAVFSFSKPTKINVLGTFDVDFANFELSSEIARDADNKELPNYKVGSAIDKVNVTLTDSIDPSISVTFSLIEKDGSESYLEYNGVRYIIYGCSFLSYSYPFKVAFDNQTNFITIGESKVKACKIDTCDNGNRFYGFTSGAIYVDFEVPEVEGVGAIGIGNIGGQEFKSATKRDRSGPIINIYGAFSDVKLGGKIEIPAAEAFDYISGVKSLTVTVSANKVVVLDSVPIDKPIQVDATEYGEYKILYRAVDMLGNPKERNFSVKVWDEVPPTITLSGNVPTTAKVNEEIVLPTMTATDNDTKPEKLKTYVYYIAPNGYEGRVTDNKFTPNQKGTYVVVYFAQDLDGATTTDIHYITVR